MPGILIVGGTLVVGCWALTIWRLMGAMDDQGEEMEDRE